MHVETALYQLAKSHLGLLSAKSLQTCGVKESIFCALTYIFILLAPLVHTSAKSRFAVVKEEKMLNSTTRTANSFDFLRRMVSKTYINHSLQSFAWKCY